MVSIVLALNGLFLLWYRLWPRRRPTAPEPLQWPCVSLVVPARNEAALLPVLLRSLKKIDYPHLQIIVVDDRSEDATAAVAESFGVDVIRGEEKPGDWFGKPWACHQGSQVARGDYLVFTDADTLHHPASLKRALAEIIHHQAQGLTALPYHQNPAIWERWLGPFQLLLLALTAPYGRPRKGRVFAIGQYLLFETSFYKKVGGHAAIRNEPVDDISLAELTLAHSGRWHVHTGDPLYQVRMYDTPGAFLRGWRRNFRGGMRHNSPLSSLEVVLFFMAMTIGIEGTRAALGVSFLTLTCLALTQNKIGRYSFWGIIALPVSIVAFTVISILAVYDRIRARPLIWKSRLYP